MAEDYERLIAAAAARPTPHPRGLPAHLVDDHSEPARAIARQFGVELDIL